MKKLAVSQGFDSLHFSTKSWKKGTVSQGVSQGESNEQVKARGDHRTWSASTCYQVASTSTEPPPGFGLAKSVVVQEIDRWKTTNESLQQRLGFGITIDSHPRAPRKKMKRIHLVGTPLGEGI